LRDSAIISDMGAQFSFSSGEGKKNRFF